MQLGRIGIILTSLIPFVIGATVSGFIELPGDELTNLDLVHTSIELLEIQGAQSNSIGLKRNAHINSEGVFNFHDIPKGSYLLSVSHIEYNLVPFKSRVDVLENDEVKVHLVQAAQKWDDKGPEIPQPIRFIPNTKFPERQYIKNRSPGILESGPIATVVNNPLYLAMAFLAIIAVVAPYLLEKFDPETAKLLKEQKAQRNVNSSAAALKAAESLNFDLGEKIGSSRASKVNR
ncbi:putative membrane protein [Wickerhamomyces ciferrii]|uniref:Protein SOP4 n=1 Tax=Wickerhamomyces ciferrii (strain ATCC 14091 / BCRC 22168 / CBS 111 / JCM 3599 / NBRC 0793 / NRRL Y-1031 F-60-10) TaxID=1206466 RepID=K0KMV8_WICCF|nr:uncharacterized protein BN7_2008 [Wickerhamomyces ciferrii]CCH42463.1 putative membrane protein [Wickerhamomyces ciferrii]